MSLLPAPQSSFITHHRVATFPLQPHALQLFLVRCLRACIGQASANTAGRCVRQLQHNGENSSRFCRIACCQLCCVTSRVAEQIAAYCVSAFAGGIFFFLWRLMSTENRRRVWRLYGWYSALMFCGSCFGVLTWAARMMNLGNFFIRKMTKYIAHLNSDPFG